MDLNQVFFEVVGSADQLSHSLSQTLGGLVSGQFSTLTFIVNLNQNHWTTVVVTRQPAG